LIIFLNVISAFKRLVFVFTMAYQSVLHLVGQIYDYGNFTLDVTTQIMITTQKLTTLAFAYYDGTKLSETLSPDQKEQVVK
jgi:hypothetical protein